MHSLLAAWRVSLYRTRADWPIVAAAWLIVLLAATLLAAGPIYSSAVSLAGLHRVLEDAPVADANIEVTARVNLADAGLVVERVATQLRAISERVDVGVVTAGRSDTFTLPGQLADEVRDLAVLGFLDGIEEHASLISGAWPATAGTGEPMQVAIGEQIADTLGLGLGDALPLVSRLDATRTLDLVVSGIYRPTDPLDPYWWGDPALVDGAVESASYRTFGPLIGTRDDLLGRAAGSTVAITWHAFPSFGQLSIDEIGPMRSAVERLPARVEAVAAGSFPKVRTGLGEILATSERSLLVSRTGILLLMAQLAILAGYAIVLTAALIVDHRRPDTALLRSRGAGPLQVGWLALAEGLLLALPAGLAGPWLAAGALRLLNVAGPLAGIGLTVEPTVSTDAYVAAAVAAVGCTLLLVLPALVAARSFAAEQAGRSRYETRTLGQRFGLDVALVAVTVVGVWQLRLYGAPLTRQVHGALGLDPLLVAAPAIGLLAGGVVALRLLPLVAQLAEDALARGRDLVGSLGARQLARRPLRYTRAALLLMLAMSMGVFAVSYATTWIGSQRDQAAFQVGADLRIRPAVGPSALPGWSLATAYASIGGIGATMPVERQRMEMPNGTGAGELLAVDPAVAGQIVPMRADLADRPLTSLLTPLVAARPAIDGVPVPDEPERLLVSATLAIDELVGPGFDPETGELVVEPIDTAILARQPLMAVTVFVRDARGVLHRFAGEPIPYESGAALVVVPLAAASEAGRRAVVDADATPAYPIDVVAVDLVISLPEGTSATAGAIGLDAVSASDDADGESWRELDLDAAGGWQLGWSQGVGVPIAAVPSDQVVGRGMRLGTAGAFAELPGVDSFGHGVTVSFVLSPIVALVRSELAAVVNGQFLSQTATQVGDLVSLRLEGGARDVRIVGTMRSFPATDPGRPLALVDLASLGMLRLEAAHTTRVPTEWWLQADPAAVTIAESRSEGGPFARATVTSRAQRTASLSADPLALGIIGALALGFAVAGLFAVIGLAASAAVSARQRRGEFALLRALGLSGGQLSGWLWLENASLVLVSLVAGTGLGLLIGWVVLPYVTVTQQAGSPFPPLLVEVPWDTILVLEAVSAAALGLTVVGLATVLRRAGVGSVLRMGGE